jgi:hypothetical protein
MEWGTLEWAEWRSFSAKEVELHAPDAAGLYALRTDASGPLAYLGQSASIARRLRQRQTSDLNDKNRVFSPLSQDLEFSFIATEKRGLRSPLEFEVLSSHLAEFGIPPLLCSTYHRP